MSFSASNPPKATRSLKRTGSYLSLSDMQMADTLQALRAGTSASHMATQLYACQPRHTMDRRKIAVPGTTSKIAVPSSSSPKPRSSKTPFPRQRTTSPLSPVRAVLPARAAFPRSKPEPDLYRVAITTRMRNSPQGQKILHMGPRLAFSIFAATQELERIVAAQPRDDDFSLSGGESMLSTSWVLVPPEDWEMVDSRA